MHKIIITSLILFSLYGCMYKYSYTDKKNIPVNKSLIGMWKVQPPDKNNKKLYDDYLKHAIHEKIKIKKQNKYEYFIEYYDETSKEDTIRFIAWDIKILNTNALQLKMIYDDKEEVPYPYLIAKYFIKNDTFFYQILDPSIINIGKQEISFKKRKTNQNLIIPKVESQQLYIKQINDNINNPDLWGDETQKFSFIKEK